MFEGSKIIDLRSPSSVGTGGGTTVSEDHRIIELEGMFKEAYSTMYVEYAYNGDQLSGIDVWTNVLKMNKLFEKQFTYSGSQLQQTTLTDLKTGWTLTMTYSYIGEQLVAKYRSIATA